MNYIEDLLKSAIKTERVDGFKKLVKAGLPIPEVKIIDHQAFLLFKEKGMCQPLQKEIEAVFLKLRTKYPSRGFYVGRAYSVPGFTNPPGPYSVVKDAQEMVAGVIKLYEFALQNNYNKPGAKIGVITHPWVDPKAPFGGGCVSLVQNGPKKIMIEAIYGLDEGVQSFPHDFYIINAQKDQILDKAIAEKRECLQADKNFKVLPVNVSSRLWLKPVLSEREVFQVANYFRKFIKLYGPHRMEFAFEKEGLFFRECIPFIAKKEKAPEIHEEGKVFRLNTKSDLPKIGREQRFIFVDPIVIKRRQMNLLTFLATNASDKKIILYPGSATTGHAATIFRETGHLVVFVGNEFFDDGERVLVETKNGELVAQKL